MPESTEDARQRYLAAAHAMQSGVAMEMNYDSTATEPKHLRVGVNSAMSDLGGLARLLIAKGIITEEEYFTAVADAMEAEKASYARHLTQRVGATVNLR